MLTGTGPEAIQVRAIDDSGNIQTPTDQARGECSTCPCSIFGALTPATPAVADSTADHARDPLRAGGRRLHQRYPLLQGRRQHRGPRRHPVRRGRQHRWPRSNFGNETTSGLADGLPSRPPCRSPPVRPTSPPTSPPTVTTPPTATSSPTGASPPAADRTRWERQSERCLRKRRQASRPRATSRPTTTSTRSGAAPTPPRSSVSTVSPTGRRRLGPDDRPRPERRSTAPRTPSSINVSLVDADNVEVARDDQPTTRPRRRSPSIPSQGLGPGHPVHRVRSTRSRPPGWPWRRPTSGRSRPSSPHRPTGSARAPSSTRRISRPATRTTTPTESRLGMAFTSSQPRSVTGIRFFKQPGNGGAHTVALWNSSGDRLATAPVSGESTSGWQQASFAGPVSIAANTTYIASYFAPVGRYSAKANGLADKITRGPLSTVVQGGRYVYNATAAPLDQVEHQLLRRPGRRDDPRSGPDGLVDHPRRRGPVGSGRTPRSRPTSTGTSSPAPRSSRSSGPVTGSRSTGNLANETGGASATFTPIGALDAGTKYTVTVSGARSSTGTAMTSPYTGTFTTAGAAACPCSLMETTTTPDAVRRRRHQPDHPRSDVHLDGRRLRQGAALLPRRSQHRDPHWEPVGRRRRPQGHPDLHRRRRGLADRQLLRAGQSDCR